MSDPAASPQPVAEAAPRPIRAWAVAIGVLLALGLAALTPMLAQGTGRSPAGWMYLPIIPFVVGMLLAYSRVLHAREAMLTVCLMITAAGVANSGLAGPWMQAMFFRPGLDREPSSKAVAEQYPPALSLPPMAQADKDPAYKALLDGFRTGHEPPPNPPADWAAPPVPWSMLAPVLGNTGLLVGLGLLMVFALAAVTARQWAQHERLQNPLAETQAALLDPAILRNRLFLLGAGLALGLWAWNAASLWLGTWFPLPAIKTDFKIPDLYKMLHMESAGGEPKQIMEGQWSTVQVVPIVIGVAFLLSLEMGFSVWAGFWGGVVAFGWIYAAGMPVNFPNDGRIMGCGATLAMAVFIVWLGRHHYWQLLRVAVWPLAKGGDDRVGVWGMRTLLLACAGMLAATWWYGESLPGALLAVLFALTFLITIARVIAEAGLPFFQSADLIPKLSIGIGLPMLLPYKAVLAMHWLGSVLIADTRENVAGMVAQAAGVGERQRLGTGRLLVTLGLVAAAAAAIALLVGIWYAWTGPGLNWSGGSVRASAIIAKAAEPLNRNLEPSTLWWNQFLGSPFLWGVGAVLVVIALRRLWSGFAFHPLGLVIAFSYPIWGIWGSLMLGWLGKLLVLRYGGTGLFSRLKPLAYGLIAGELLGYFVQYAVVYGSYWHTGTALPFVRAI